MTKNEMMLSKSTNKSHATQEVGMVTINVKTWRALLKIAGSQIDPETAVVCCRYGQIVDPYGVYLDLPAECDCVGRLFFARNPESEVWIEFDDLPESTRNALWNRPDKGPGPRKRFRFRRTRAHSLDSVEFRIAAPLKLKADGMAKEEKSRISGKDATYLAMAEAKCPPMRNSESDQSAESSDEVEVTDSLPAAVEESPDTRRQRKAPPRVRKPSPIRARISGHRN